MALKTIIVKKNITNVFIIICGIFLTLSCANQTTNKKQSTIVHENKISTLDSLNALINENPGKAELFAQRSVEYQNMGEHTHSIKDMTQAYKLDSLNVEYMVSLSDKYLQFGKSEKTREFLLKAEKTSPADIEVLYRIANLYFYVRDYKKSFAYLKKAKEVDPFYAPLYFTYGMIYKETGDTTKAIEQLQIAVEREPKYYDAYVVLGFLYSGLNNPLAISYYDNALNILPNSYEVNYAKAMFYQNNEKPEDAIAVYNNILKDSTNIYPNVYFNLGYIEMIYFAEYNTALAYFDSASQLQNNYAEAYNNMGFCLEQLGKRNQAINFYEKALEINADLKEAALGLKRLKFE